MRRFTRGAAAVAAICAGALTMTTAATAFTGVGSGSDAKDYRVAGTDRIQTSLEGLEDFSDQKVNVVIVGYQGVVDALSLAPLTNTIGETVVIYSNSKGLDSRTIADLKAAQGNIQDIMISGGPGVVPFTVEDQLVDLGFDRSDLIRFNGADRYETSYITGAFVQNFAGMRKATRDVAQREYLKRILPGLQKAFEDAKAKHEAAVADHLAKQDVYLEAAAKYTQELVKVTGGPSAATALANLKSAVAIIRTGSTERQSLIEARDNELVKIDHATKVLGQTEAAVKGQVDMKLIDVDKYTKDASVKQAIKDLIAKSAVLKAPAAVTMSDTVGEAREKLNKGIEYYDTMISNQFSNIAQWQVDARKAIDDEDALTNPSKPVYQAAQAYLAAKKAFDASVIAEGKAYGKMMTARKNFEVVFFQSVNDFDLAEYRGVLKKETRDSYAKGDYNIFLATGLNFADALTAGPAAASLGKAVILLSNGKNTPAYVMDAVKGTHRTVYGIGGPAAASYANAVPVVGKDRYETSVKVSREFFKSAKGIYALASGEVGADAVIAGTYLASANLAQNENNFQGILLTRKASLPASVADFVQYGNHGQNQKPVTHFVVFGGEGAIERGVVAEARALTHN